MAKRLAVIAAVMALGCAGARDCTPAECTETDLGFGLVCQACGISSPSGSCYLVTCVGRPEASGVGCLEDGTFSAPTVPSPCQGRNY